MNILMELTSQLVEGTGPSAMRLHVLVLVLGNALLVSSHEGLPGLPVWCGWKLEVVILHRSQPQQTYYQVQLEFIFFT